MPLVDLWLWDVKTTPEKHEELTGVPSEQILENLKQLDQSGASTILRCPLVPGVNDSDAKLKYIATLANVHSHIRQIDLEPYHPMVENKGEALGKENVFHSEFATQTDKIRGCKMISSLTQTPVHI